MISKLQIIQEKKQGTNGIFWLSLGFILVEIATREEPTLLGRAVLLYLLLILIRFLFRECMKEYKKNKLKFK